MMLLDAGHLQIGVDAVQMFYCRVRRKEEGESTSTTLSSCTESPGLCLVQHSPTDCMLQPWLPEPALGLLLGAKLCCNTGGSQQADELRLHQVLLAPLLLMLASTSHCRYLAAEGRGQFYFKCDRQGAAGVADHITPHHTLLPSRALEEHFDSFEAANAF